MRSTIDLEPHRQRLLDDLVTRLERALRTELATLAVQGAVAAVCLGFADDGNVIPSPVDVLSEDDWTAALTIEDPYDRWESVWNVGQWPWEISIAESFERRPDVDDQMLTWIEEAGARSPSRWLFEAVSHRLSNDPPRGATPLFVCFAGEDGPGEDLGRDIDRVAPAEVVTKLERLDLLHPPQPST